MSEPESIADVRKRSWKTRREKYGVRGHGGSYCHPQPIYTARWNERLRSMEAALIRLYREGVLSEGQVSKATGLDRVSCRDLAIRQAEAENARLDKGLMYISPKFSLGRRPAARSSPD